MQITIKGRHIELTPALKNHVTKRVEKLKKYTDNILTVSVILSVEKYRHISEINIHVDDQLFVSKAETDDLYASVDQCIEKLDTQLNKRKARYSSSRKKERSDEAEGEETADTE
ncbi:MAG: ribosome-associated translation inhibitor RaiA [Candidatus Schekmanbacteria bacterium]|nr:ribosome-associated translation inhibitor RaiA [Candidatus Schekmanbacteria bacterium]